MKGGCCQGYRRKGLWEGPWPVGHGIGCTEASAWGSTLLTALRTPPSPQVCISFDQADLSIKLPDGYTFKFPNRLNLEAINYLAAEGDFKIKCVAFE